ncbi:MAG: hypothetical protein C4530_12145 [Desulfobacteraceae bacterium]|nr:MAG: hypothetical protein C4530_12145 [Desulfobacteraceae bacterium]
MDKLRSCTRLWVVAFLALGCSGSVRTAAVDRMQHSLSQINFSYARMQKTELSDLMEDLSAIIHERLDCYSQNVMALDRVADCRKKYIRQIVELCRRRIKSAPRLGDAILCLQYCPISQAVCRGDNIDLEDADCTPAESKCIEYCLDLFWRGGTLPKEMMP